jgi:ribosomal protein S8
MQIINSVEELLNAAKRIKHSGTPKSSNQINFFMSKIKEHRHIKKISALNQLYPIWVMLDYFVKRLDVLTSFVPLVAFQLHEAALLKKYLEGKINNVI